MKRATELQRARRAGTVHLLDEPTTGLHPADTDVLLRQLDSLVDSGSSVAQGTPEKFAADPADRTAPYLAERIA